VDMTKKRFSLMSVVCGKHIYIFSDSKNYSKIKNIELMKCKLKVKHQ